MSAESDDQHRRFGCPLPSLRPVCEQMVGSPARVPAVVDSDDSICDQMMDMAVRLHWLAGGMKDPARSRLVRAAADRLYAMVGELLDTR